MLFKLKTGIVINEQLNTYDVMREDNGALIDEIPLSADAQFVRMEIERLERTFDLFIVNKVSLLMQLESGFHPELEWRPGTHNSFRKRSGQTWREMKNMVYNKERRRQGGRPTGRNFDGRP